MANTGNPNSAGSQYFITVEPYLYGNYSYAAFGNVVEGYDVVENINEVPTTGSDGSPANKPLEDVIIDSVRVMTPQLNGYAPEEHILNQVVGDTQVFAIFSDEMDLSFTWYVNDELQGESSSIFVYIFFEPGDFIIRGNVSNGDYVYTMEWEVEVTSTDVVNNNIPDAVTLMQNYPNPFKYNNERGGVTTIPFNLKEKAYVTLDLFNLKGQHMINIFEGISEAGSQEISWNGLDTQGNQFKSGIYLYRMKSKGKEETKKIVIIK